ncbi:MAG TPA: response regulator transcription factor [Nevskiales bacterium]|nr:response regulator transcription factor [Nevskiales bacterium]
MRVLVVEDDPALREQLSSQLRAAGYAVDTAPDGQEGLYRATEFPLDAAVVDIGLPQLSGIDLIRQVRKQGRSFPILILTARDRWQSKVEGLEAGADDYLVKPFQPEEMLARVRALIRRSGGWAQPVLQCGPLTMDTTRQQVTKSGQPVELTAYEYKILHYLMLHAGEVASKTTLAEHIYEDETERDSNVIEVFIRRLRLKLDPDGTLNPIETLRGRGYRLNLPRINGQDG